MLWAGPPGYPTPVFDPSDPILCRSLSLRPSLWAVVFDALQRLGEPYSWIQDNPAAATPGEVAMEVQHATDKAVFQGCAMIGDIVITTRDPASWELVCDGSVYNRVDYPDLYAVINPVFIIDADTFAVPDAADRFIFIGAGIGDVGGESAVTLAEAEMPAHTHTEGTTGITGLFVAPGEVPAIISAGAGVTGSAGGGGAHNNMPPYITMTAVIIARYPDGT